MGDIVALAVLLALVAINMVARGLTPPAQRRPSLLSRLRPHQPRHRAPKGSAS